MECDFETIWNTSKSLSEAFILTSTNPQYDKRLFVNLPVQYMRTTSSEHVVYINCYEYQNKNQFVYTTCSELAVFMYWTGKSMNNLLSYCGLVDSRISASDKDLPVSTRQNNVIQKHLITIEHHSLYIQNNGK